MIEDLTNYSSAGVDPIFLIVPDQNKMLNIPYLVEVSFLNNKKDFLVKTKTTIIIYRKKDDLLIGFDIPLKYKTPFVSGEEIDHIKIFPLKILRDLFIIEGHSSATIHEHRFLKKNSIVVKCKSVFRKVDWVTYMTNQNRFQPIKEFIKPIEEYEYDLMEKYKWMRNSKKP